MTLGEYYLKQARARLSLKDARERLRNCSIINCETINGESIAHVPVSLYLELGEILESRNSSALKELRKKVENRRIELVEKERTAFSDQLPIFTAQRIEVTKWLSEIDSLTKQSEKEIG